MNIKPDELDISANPVWTSLTGRHARFTTSHGRAVMFEPDISPFAAVTDWNDEGAWADLAKLAGPQSVVAVAGVGLVLPAGWDVVWHGEGLQLVDVAVEATEDAEAVRLTAEDVPEMLDLVARTEPGPFAPRTIELGTYLGIRRDGALVAMAGERLRVPGLTEISAVCTDPGYRGQGLASRLVKAVAAGIRARGETPFLHAADFNTNAIRLYESMGFKVRTEITFAAVRTP
ncbi:GNAT family N-acetyltransferase [Micromonospora sp. NBC_01699]|uniref:GNAT family N-acetyltransferase n=1 Tax=Micromonospora sp. NBC_01699 TaxID=2975984 RepID=UPI002E3688E5|nr:GNAT family N-acetyltransferase [Micromonospora sp. NBC_01699]